MSDVKFCWHCSKKLWNGIHEELKIDHHPRVLHKTCAKEVKREYDFVKRDGEYHSVMWNYDEEWKR